MVAQNVRAKVSPHDGNNQTDPRALQLKRAARVNDGGTIVVDILQGGLPPFIALGRYHSIL